jgi:hypothetical protein
MLLNLQALCQNNAMTTIALDNIADDARSFLKTTVANYIESLEIVEKKDNPDLIVTLPNSWQKPLRMGAIIDFIEKTLFDHNYNIDIGWKRYHLNIKDHCLTIDVEAYQLSLRETDLCAALLKAGEKGCSRDSLLNQVWGYRADLETHALETQIYRLRQKIEKVPDDPQIIVTIDGGYKFA